MTHQKIDRRIQRTRRLLRDALVALILEKRYDKITVQDIIDRADVGRSTFYAHYQDKEDLLTSSFTELSHDLDQHVVAASHEAEGDEHLVHSLVFFRHAQAHQYLYKAIVEGGGGDLLVETGRQHMQASIEAHLGTLLPDERQPAVPLPVISNYLAGGLLSLLFWWLEEGMPYTAAEINEMFRKLAMPGVLAMLA